MSLRIPYDLCKRCKEDPFFLPATRTLTYKLRTTKQLKYFGEVIRLHYEEGYDKEWMCRYGCVQVVMEKSEHEKVRPQWKQLLSNLGRGDELVVSKLSNAVQACSQTAERSRNHPKEKQTEQHRHHLFLLASEKDNATNVALLS